MKALSMWQPWASLWFTSKIHETRDRRLVQPGWLAVHATKRIVHELEPRLRDIVDSDFGGHWGMELPRGAIIGVVNILGVVPAADVFGAQNIDVEGYYPDDFYCGNFAEGRFAFKRGEYRLLREPIPWRGHQAPFDIPDDVVREVMAA